MHSFIYIIAHKTDRVNLYVKFIRTISYDLLRRIAC